VRSFFELVKLLLGSQTKEQLFAVRPASASVSDSDERGAVLLEWAIVVAGLLLGLMILFDTGNGLYTYMMVSHIAAEGARSGGKVPALEEPGEYVDEDIGASVTDIKTCESGSGVPASLACGHYLISSRLRLMATTLPLGVDPTLVSISSELLPASGTAGVENGTVVVQVSVDFDGLLINLPIRASRQGPYLFRS